MRRYWPIIFCIFITATNANAVIDYTSSYSQSSGDYWTQTCEQKQSRGLASYDPNGPEAKQKETSKKIRSHAKRLKKFPRFVDLDKDGKVECERSFYKNSYQVKKEVCDVNHDGVVDQVLKFSRKGVLKHELTNLDKDNFFESQIRCKGVLGEPGLVLCHKQVDISGDNKRNESYYFYKKDEREYMRYLVKRKSKKQSRGIASTEKTRFDESKLPQGVGYEWSLKKYGAKKELKLFQEEKRPYMKYFRSFEGYRPGIYDQCLTDGRNSCQKIDYLKIGAVSDGFTKDQEFQAFNSCMNYYFHACSDSRGSTEGGNPMCYGCLSEDKYFDFLNEISTGNGDDVSKEAPEGFFTLPGYDFLFQESCRPHMDFSKINIQDDLSCLTVGADDTSVFTRHQGLRSERITQNKYDKYSTMYDGTSHELPKEMPNSWKLTKKKLDKKCRETNCERILFEGDQPSLKILCTEDPKVHVGSNTGEQTRAVTGTAGEFGGLVYSPPAVHFDIKKLKTWNTKSLQGYLTHELGHVVSHALGHSHGYPKLLEKGPNKGKWRCNWTPEIDYAYLCNTKNCHEMSNDKYRCDSEPGSHIDKETGDLTQLYMSSIYMARGARRFHPLVSRPEDCH